VYRKQYINLLLDKPLSVPQLARMTGESPKDIAQDLQHLFVSLRHTEFEPWITPAECRKCGFEFAADKLKRPSKCPECKSTWIYEPLIAIRKRPS